MRLSALLDDVQTIDLEPVTADDDTAERLWRFHTAVLAHDAAGLPAPPAEYVVGRIRHPRGDEERLEWVLRRDGRIVAALDLRLPLVDNTSTVLTRVVVDPALRRQGVGTVLLQRALDVASERWRTHLIGEIGRPVDADSCPGDGFAAAAGFSPALAELTSRLALEQLDEPTAAALQREADLGSVGYLVRTWSGVPDDDVLAALATLERTLSRDAPMDELRWEAEIWDADRVRSAHQVVERRGVRAYHAVAQSPRGAIVAWTQLSAFPSRPLDADQWATVVHPQHRGHRLGLAVKLANLAQLRAAEPAVRHVWTSNAESNAHMLRVNRAMRFAPAGLVTEWQRDL